MIYLHYSDALDQPAPDEMRVIGDIIDVMTQESETERKKLGHSVRVSHAKATGLLIGTFEVLDELPTELAQGLFAKPGRYTALARFAQGSGELLDDKVSTHRGVGLKIIGVPGTKILESDEAETQDWVLENGNVFPNPDPASFLRSLRGIARAPYLPQAVKEAVSGTSRAVNKVLDTVGAASRKLDFLGHPYTHPLNEAYFSQVPIRFGDHVAKIGLFPIAAAQLRLPDLEAEAKADPNAFRHAVTRHTREQPTEFELRVQLATDLDSMPIEDATAEWSEEKSPYRRVARLSFPPQPGYDEARREFFDERLSFKPAHSLVEHRPIGGIMRARLRVYAALAAKRFASTGTSPFEPRSRDDVPF